MTSQTHLKISENIFQWKHMTSRNSIVDIWNVYYD